MLTDEHKRKIEYLREYLSADKEVDRLTDELEKWSSRARSVTNTLSAMPSVRKKSDKVADSVVNFDEIERELRQAVQVVLRLKRDIEQKINSVKEPHLRELLKARYLDGKTWGS